MSRSTESLELVFLSAAGNRFAVADAFAGDLPSNPGGLARVLGERGDVDGLLLLQRPSAKGAGADCRMVLFNRDGSRPEACGNGLRCIARLAVERGHVAGDQLTIETDAGPRRVRILREAGRIVAACTEMGAPVVEAESEALQLAGGSFEVGLVSLGNPHCVLFVEDVDAFPVADVGGEIERHARFPERTNVEFVQVDGDGLRVRIFERGVGETDSCGTGVSAAAAIALRRGLVSSPVAIETRGGRLHVAWDGAGPLELTGPIGPLGETS